MTPKQALQLLDKATQPGVSLTRIDYINIQIALETLSKLLPEETEPPCPPTQ